MGSGPSRASVMDRVKSAVKKHGPTVKAGLKKAGKAAARGAGYAAGAAVRGAKAAGREFSKGYERGRKVLLDPLILHLQILIRIIFCS